MIKEILDEIAAESSTKQKMVILGKYKEDLLLKEFLYKTKSSRVKFYIKQIPEHTLALFPEKYSLEQILKEVEKFSSRELTGHAATIHLKDLLEGTTIDNNYLLQRVIDKSLKINMGRSNINKVFIGLIEKTGYMGAKPYSKKLVNNIMESNPINFSQEKMDGRYVNVIICNNEVEMTSRQGEPTTLEGAVFLKDISNLQDCVLNGELTMALPEGGIMDRYSSNGIIASLIDINKKKAERTDAQTNKKIEAFEKKHMNFNKALSLIQLSVWDLLTIDEYYELKSENPYNIRFYNLKTLLEENKLNMVSLVPTIEVHSMEDVLNHFYEILSNNGEGTILKSFDGEWKNGKPNTQIKLKKEIELDLKIVNFNYGSGKNSEVISSLNCESKCGLLKTSPTGIKENEMLNITEQQTELLGTIVAVKCSGISQDSKGNYSLLHPVFKGLRIGEKEEANSLEECIEIDKSSQFI